MSKKSYADFFRPKNSVSSTKATLAKQQEQHPALPQPILRLHRCDAPAVTVEDTPEEEDVAPPPKVPTPAPRMTTPAPRRLETDINRLGGILAEMDVLFAEASSLADSREWSEDEVDAVQAARLSRHDQQKLYKSPTQTSLTSFFQALLDGRKPDNAAPAQPGNAAPPKKKRNRRKKQKTTAPAPPTVAVPAASEKTQRRKDERSGNLATQRSGNLARHLRTVPHRRPEGALKVHHRDLPENKKLLSRARRVREDYCRRFNVPLRGFRNNDERLRALIANRPVNYRPV